MLCNQQQTQDKRGGTCIGSQKTWSESISSNINRIKGRQNSHSAGVDPNSNKKADIKQKEWLASIETLLELLPDPISNELREFASLLAIQHTVPKLFTQPRYRLIYPLDNQQIGSNINLELRKRIVPTECRLCCS
jgi:hypothetical protein